MDINPADEVITAPITDLGTVIPILSLNAIPVFADIDHTYNMDPQDVERKITSRTRAIVVVHLFGNPCDMDALAAIARKHKIPIIEDCSQAHVTEYKGRLVGTIGDIGCFSFQQSKHMTTGDGGMTITSNKAYYERMKLYVDKGFMRKGWGARAYGFHAPNYRMNELTGAVGRAQLKKVKEVVAKRQAMGSLLTRLLSDIPDLVPAPVTEGAKPSYWLYPVRVKNVDLEQFAKAMTAAGFWCAAGYTGKPIYLCSESLTAKKTYGTSQFPFNSAYASRPYEYKEGLCPRAEETLTHLVTMPWDESWDEAKIHKAAAAFKETLRKLNPAAVAVAPSASPKTEPLKKTSPSTGDVANRVVRIGIIGCGQMGRWHLNAYKKNPQVQCAAFADTDIKKADQFAREAAGRLPLGGGNAYSDYREMLKREKLDGISVCTIPSTHPSIVTDLLDAGIHVLCEKPLAVSADQARAMVSKAEEKNKLLLTAFKFRFFEEVQKAKEILSTGGMGRVLSFRLMFGGHINMEGTWYADKDCSGGGVIMDNGPHAFDLIQYLLGPISRVWAQTSTTQNIQVEDTALISCVLENGAAGSMDISWNTAVPSQNYLEIYAVNGCLFLDFGGISYKFKTWDEFKRVPNQADIRAAFRRQIDHFVDAITTKKPSIVKMMTALLLKDGSRALIVRLKINIMMRRLNDRE